MNEEISDKTERSDKLFNIISKQLNLLKDKDHVVELTLDNEKVRCFGVVECKIKVNDNSHNVCLHFLLTEDNRYHFSYTIKNKTNVVGFTNSLEELKNWALIYLNSMYLSKIHIIDAQKYKKKYKSLMIFPVKKNKKSWIKFILILIVIFLVMYLFRKFINK